MTKLQIKNFLIKQLIYYRIEFIFKGKLYIHNGSQMHHFVTKEFYRQIDIIYIFHYFINSGTYLRSSFLFFKVELIAKELGFSI